MKSFLRRSIVLSLVFFLMSCAHYYPPSYKADLLNERWMPAVDRDPNPWLSNVDHWFLHPVSPYPRSVASSVMLVPLPSTVTRVQIAGHFQVKFMITPGSNRVEIEGPHALIQRIGVKVTQKTLMLIELPKPPDVTCASSSVEADAKDTPNNIGCVVVRIGLKHITSIAQTGPGLITGQIVGNDALCVTSSGSGDIYLAGSMPVSGIRSSGRGDITLLGVVSPDVVIVTSGTGTVNVYGNVGVRSIVHTGQSNINVIGVNTNHLTIDAGGCGKIGLYGMMAIDCINARSHVIVYAYNVSSHTLKVNTVDYAVVGLAGSADTFTVNTRQASRFMGYHLYTHDAFARSYDASHITTRANKQLFAAASGDSSVYGINSARVLTQVVKRNGVVLAIPAS
ncbi:MAG: hypothetical protein A3F43_06460 [Gammaproteobacteria bacterium RIFCSPHIGHO2_12_FULL_42_10]|nr:MAG: hypothetical protein A3F43_06460 [Gammaproteobacteria bacterium RIFCSPHIGHO2_12_FULL_42_10]